MPHSISLTVPCMMPWGRRSPVAATCWHGRSACAVQASPQHAAMTGTGSVGSAESVTKMFKQRTQRLRLRKERARRAQMASLGGTKAAVRPTLRRQSPRPAMVDGLALLSNKCRLSSQAQNSKILGSDENLNPRFASPFFVSLGQRTTVYACVLHR